MRLKPERMAAMRGEVMWPNMNMKGAIMERF
jgi:hypothetical protein